MAQLAESRFEPNFTWMAKIGISIDLIEISNIVSVTIR